MSQAGAEAFGPWRVTLTGDEFAAHARRLGARQQMKMQMRYGYVVPLAALAILAAVVAALNLGGWLDARGAQLTFFLSSLAFLGGKFVNHRQILRAHAVMAERMRAETSLYSDEKTISADASGVVIDMKDARSEHRWSSYTEAEIAGGMAFLWMGIAYGVCLPERAFANRADMDAFVAFANRAIAGAARP